MEDRCDGRQHHAVMHTAQSLAWMVLLTLLCIGLGACGSSGGGSALNSQRTSSRAAATGTSTSSSSLAEQKSPYEGLYTPVDRDRDNDSPGVTDDTGNESSYDEVGPLAGHADAQAITALVKRYYALAVAKDGSHACALIVPALAKSVPEDYGEVGGPPAMRGAVSCREGMTRLFASLHGNLEQAVPTMRVLQVRVRGKNGMAVLHVDRVERQILVRQDGHGWRVAMLLDGPVA